MVYKNCTVINSAFPIMLWLCRYVQTVKKNVDDAVNKQKTAASSVKVLLSSSSPMAASWRVAWPQAYGMLLCSVVM